MRRPISYFSYDGRPRLVRFRRGHPGNYVHDISRVLFRLLYNGLLYAVDERGVLPRRPFFFYSFSFHGDDLVCLGVDFQQSYVRLRTIVSLVTRMRRGKDRVHVTKGRDVSLRTFMNFMVYILIFDSMSKGQHR